MIARKINKNRIVGKRLKTKGLKAKRIRFRKIRGVKNMETVKLQPAQLSYSVLDMIMDTNKRENTFKYYDDRYVETNEEKEIFDAWRKRRKGDK